MHSDTVSLNRPRQRPRRLVISFGVVVMALLTMAALLAASATGPLSRPLGPPTEVAGIEVAASSASSLPTPIQHVVVIYFENSNRTNTLTGSYFRYLADTYAQASHYYAVCHPSAPNYLAGTGGTPLQCGSDGYKVYNSTNLGGLLQNAGISSWSGFMESMPKPCDTSTSGLYVVKHNPFVYYSNILSSPTFCAQHDQNLTAWTTDVSAGTVPTFSWITPNMDNDGHQTSMAYASNWLHGFLSPLVNDSWFASTAYLITVDEATGSGSSSGYNGTTGGNVYFTLVSPYAHKGYTSTVDYSHYNMLTTVEWLLGLGSTGHNDGTSKFPAMKDLFQFGATQTYSVSGTVTNSSGQGLAGATVYMNGSSLSTRVTTGSGGTFSEPLPNGSFELTGTYSGYRSYSTNVTVAGAPVGGITLALTRANSHPPHQFLLAGTVTDSTTGSAIGGATVFANNSTASESTVSASSGGFSFELSNGTYQLTATDTGYDVEHGSVTVAGSAAPPVTLPLQRSAPPATVYPVSGSILAYPSGAPLGGATIFANATGSSQVQPDSANGAFSLELANGSYALTVTAATFTSQRVSLVVDGAPLAGVDIELVPASLASYSAQGIVTDTASGTPVANATLFFTNGSLVVRILTNSAGGYSTALPNGTYTVTVVAEGFVGTERTVTIQGPVLSPLNFNLRPVGTSGPPGGSPFPLEYFVFSAIAVVLVCLTAWTVGRLIRRPPTRRH